MKRLAVLCLAAILCLTALTGCANKGRDSSENSISGADGTSSVAGDGSAGTAAGGEPYEVNFVYLVASAGPNTDKVRDAVNELALKELNMTVNLIPLTFSEFTTQLPMMLAANEPIDLMPLGAGLGPTYISSQYIVDVTDYLDQVPTVKLAVGEEFLTVGTIDNFLTGFPIMKEQGGACTLVVRKDILEEVGFSAGDFTVTTEDMSTFDQVTQLFAAVKEAHPEMTVFDGTGAMGTNMMCYVDTLGDGFGVLEDYGQSTTVTNVYESDLFRQLCQVAKNWYDQGYSSKDIAVNADSGEVKMKAGNTFSFVSGYKPNIREEKLSQTGYEVEVILLSDAMSSGGSAILYSVANASKDPAKAVEFFNWCYGNGEFSDLINWGIEGEDWVELEDGTIDYPEGVDATNVGYHQDMGWMYPNQFAGHVWKGNPPDILEQYEAFNSGCIQSKALGFSYDSSAMVNEVAQMNAVLQKYQTDLAFGVVDLDATIEALNGELYAAGLEKVMQAKQEKLDAWLAER